MFYKQFFSEDVVAQMLANDIAIDGTKGGFIIGNSHSEGGIPVLYRYSDGYYLEAMFEGLEYLVKYPNSLTYSGHLIHINQLHGDRNIPHKKEYSLNTISIIDCRLENHYYKSKFIIIDSEYSQFVVNSHSTDKYLNIIESINSSTIRQKQLNKLYQDLKKPNLIQRIIDKFKR